MAMASMAYLTVIALLITAVASDTPAAAIKYTNHTVGDAAGWFFNTTTNTSSANYSSWAATQTFNLGDYLLFNTNTNQTVIFTYNETTYRSCIMDDASDDTFLFGGGNNPFGVPVIIAVPLTMEGTNYYYSDGGDAVQCEKGMAFEIVVNYGLGLPLSFTEPSLPPSVEPPTQSDFPWPSSRGGLRTNANLRWVVWYLLFGTSFLLV